MVRWCISKYYDINVHLGNNYKTILLHNPNRQNYTKTPYYHIKLSAVSLKSMECGYRLESEWFFSYKTVQTFLVVRDHSASRAPTNCVSFCNRLKMATRSISLIGFCRLANINSTWTLDSTNGSLCFFFIGSIRCLIYSNRSLQSVSRYISNTPLETHSSMDFIRKIHSTTNNL